MTAMPFMKSDKFEGSALECARHAQGLELDELAELSGINEKRIARFELGSAYPNEFEINALANATDVLPKFFFQAWIKPPEHAFNFRI
jgi:transcriptional regulator with XRE-family HTH domain